MFFLSHILKSGLKQNKKMKKTNIFLLVFFIVIVVLLLLNLFLEYRANKIYEPVGKIVKIDNYDYHINCLGDKNNKTIILIHELGDYSGTWYNLINSLNDNYRVCAYDRPGYGWSEGQKRQGSFSDYAEELYKLLNRAEETGPYMLIGHGFGVGIAQVFADKYSENVSGLIYLDPLTFASNKDFYTKLNKKIENDSEYNLVKYNLDDIEKLDQNIHKRGSDFLATKIIYSLGLRRFLELPEGFCNYYKRQYQAECFNNAYKLSYVQALTENIPKTFNNGYHEIIDTLQKNKDINLIVISSTKFLNTIKDNNVQPEKDHFSLHSNNPLEGIRLKEYFRQIVIEEHKNYLKGYNNSEHIITEKSGHFIHWDQPDLIIESINKVLAE